jgi:nucleoside-diphosphate-sugar epimerase
MRILITGAAGFIGQLVAKTLLDDAEGRYHLVLTDIIEPPIPSKTKWPQNAKAVKADLYAESQSVVDKDLDAVFVFHGIMSSGAEANFDLGKRSSRSELRPSS